MEKKIIAAIKKWGLVILLVLAVIWGVSSLFKNRSLYDKFSVATGQKKAVEAEYAEYKKDAEDRIGALQKDIIVLDEEKLKLAKEVDDKTREIIKIRPVITQLEESRKILTDKDAIIINQDLQIAEYKKMVITQEERYQKLFSTVQVLELQKNESLALAKEYYDLWKKELQLRKLSDNLVKELEAKYKSQGFKITVKGIGEKLLFAGLGYGLGRLTDGK